MTTLGYILLALGTLTTLLNIYFGYIRYTIHRARGRSDESLQYVSGIPIFGSLFLWISIPLVPSVGLRWFAAILSIFDTVGIHWFIGMMLWTGEWRELLHPTTDEILTPPPEVLSKLDEQSPGSDSDS
jgi:hypothetical protein